jgi:ABC-type transport system substrate-binding protein
MPFFCPLPASTPIVGGGIDAPVPGNGPYFLKDWTKRRTALVVRNPYYGGTRSANVDEIAYTFGNSLEASRLRLERGDVDLGPVPPAATAELMEKYGLNKGRFFVKKALQLSFLALNHRRPLFAGNDRLKRALNRAIDRPQIARQFGLLGAARTDQILPAGMPGYRDWNLYPLKGADVAGAKRELRPGDVRSGKATLYAGSSGPDPLVAQIVQYNAKQIGLDIEIKLFDAIVRTEKMRNADEPFDIGTVGWVGPFIDPSVFVDTLLGPDTIGSTNLSYFREAAFAKRIRAAALLVGDERYRTYAELDRELMRGPAPIVPYVNTTLRVFVSARLRNVRYNTSAPGGILLNVVSVQ